jgi:hypothetical protein
MGDGTDATLGELMNPEEEGKEERGGVFGEESLFTLKSSTISNWERAEGEE